MPVTTFTVNPLMSAFATSPAAFSEALLDPTNFRVFTDVQGVTSLCSVANTFGNALPSSEEEEDIRLARNRLFFAPSYRIQDEALELAKSLSALHTGYYAVGRRAVVDRTENGEFTPYETLGAEGPVKNVAALVTADGGRFTTLKIAGYKSEDELVQGLRFKRTSLGDEAAPFVIRELGNSEFEFVTPAQLQGIWENDKEDVERRKMAFNVWCHMTPPTTEVDYNELFELATKGKSEDLRLLAMNILGDMLLMLGTSPLLDFMQNKIMAAIRAPEGIDARVKVGLLDLYNGLLAAFSRRESIFASAIIDGALTLLDVAADDKEPEAVRMIAYSFGIYATEAWVPEGARIARDWTSWKVETEKDLHMAALFAHHYVGPNRGIIPASWQQFNAVLPLLKRNDLTKADRDLIWKRIGDGQPWLAVAAYKACRVWLERIFERR